MTRSCEKCWEYPCECGWSWFFDYNSEDLIEGAVFFVKMAEFLRVNASHIHAKKIYGGRSREEVKELWEKWKEIENE